MLKIKKKIVSLLLLLCIISATLSGASVYVYATSQPSSSGYGEAGVSPGAPSYTIWREDSTYYAKDAYGYIPSWGTSSNASQIILSAIGNGDTKTFLKKGTYTMNTLDLSDCDHHVIIEGEGRFSTILDFSGHSGIVWSASSRRWLTLRNLQILGDDTVGTYGLTLDYVKVALEWIYVKNFEEGVWLKRAQSSSFHDCEIEDAQNHAMKLYGGGNNDIQSFRNIYHGCKADNQCNLYIDYSVGSTFIGDIFEARGGTSAITSAIGIHLSNGAHNTLISGCHFENQFREILLDGSASIPHGNTISGCYFSGNSICSEATYLNNCENNTISYNTFMLHTNQALGFSANAKANTVISNFNYDPNFVAGTIDNSNIFNFNLGFITENSGTAEASNDDWIPHDLAGAPTSVWLTVEETDANYCIQLKATNATHFQIYLYDLTADALETVDKTINWSAEYQP